METEAGTRRLESQSTVRASAFTGLFNLRKASAGIHRIPQGGSVSGPIAPTGRTTCGGIAEASERRPVAACLRASLS